VQRAVLAVILMAVFYALAVASIAALVWVGLAIASEIIGSHRISIMAGESMPPSRRSGRLVGALLALTALGIIATIVVATSRTWSAITR